MCGRYTLTVTPDLLRRLFGLEITPNLEPRYNIAPTQTAPVVRAGEGCGRRMDLLRWGLVPSWSKDISIASKLINARGETVASKPAFRAAFAHRRCLVPADGFYEWRKEGADKQPYRIGFRGGVPFAFAGLWERWTPPDAGQAGETVETFTIVTTDANDKLRPIHPRMPVIVDPADYDIWLTGDAATAQTVVRPFPPDDMAFYRVSTRVNSVRNDDPECVAPFAASADG